MALLSFNVGVGTGQVTFVMLIVLLERSFRQLQIRWPRCVEALPDGDIYVCCMFGPVRILKK